MGHTRNLFNRPQLLEIIQLHPKLDFFNFKPSPLNLNTMELYLIRVEMKEDTTLLLKVFATYLDPTALPDFNPDPVFFMRILAEAIPDWDVPTAELPPLGQVIRQHSASPDTPYYDAIDQYAQAAYHADIHPIFAELELEQENTPDLPDEDNDIFYYTYDEEFQSFDEEEEDLHWALFKIELTDAQWAAHLTDGMTWETAHDFG